MFAQDLRAMPTSAFLDAALIVAKQAAHAAADVIARHWRAGTEVEIKSQPNPCFVR